jgi:excisionase family DNA binding protein
MKRAERDSRSAPKSDGAQQKKPGKKAVVVKKGKPRRFMFQGSAAFKLVASIGRQQVATSTGTFKPLVPAKGSDGTPSVVSAQRAASTVIVVRASDIEPEIDASSTVPTGDGTELNFRILAPPAAPGQNAGERKPLAPRAFSIREFCGQYGIGRTNAYQEIAAGRLRAVKFGRRTLIKSEAAEAWLAALPELKPRTLLLSKPLP